MNVPVIFKGSKNIQNVQKNTENHLFSAFSPVISSKADTLDLSYTPKKVSGIEAKFSKFENHFLAKYFPLKFISKYSDEKFLKSAVSENKNIGNILQKEGLKPEIEIENIEDLKNGHLISVSRCAEGIMKNCGEKFSARDYDVVKQASLLHDIGKAFIPRNILNKNGKLNSDEKRIVDLHAKIGYEILRTKNFDKEVLNLILNHHNAKNTLEQIVVVSDIYCALKEERPYKKAMTDDKAFKILDCDMKSGKFDKKLVDALKAFVVE